MHLQWQEEQSIRHRNPSLWWVETRVSARTGAAWWVMSVETTAPCSSRRWGEDEEMEGQSTDAAPIALHGHRPVPREGGDGKEEAAAGRGGEGDERRVAGHGQLPE